MRHLLRRLRTEYEGAALAEYGMLIGLLAVVCIAAVTLLGTDISGVFSNLASSLSTL